jgi:hypothetical protein
MRTFTDGGDETPNEVPTTQGDQPSFGPSYDGQDDEVESFM